MKFLFADSLDYVDPDYDFLRDRSAAGRKPYWDDAYPHEILGYAPYDGVLVSRGIVGDGPVQGKYSAAQAMRFRRAGARAFLRLDRPEFAHLSLFGDCGAFTYVKSETPPYTPADTAEFYDECGFTHGCSVDHIVFDFDDSLLGLAGGSPEARRRVDITLENARAFLSEARQTGRFQPLGVVQGWSPASMADAARQLVAMGYDYLAIGGLVPLKPEQIKSSLLAIRDAIPSSTRLHLLGFGKADQFAEFMPLGITSFDTTSPLIRAFKDDRQNYWLPAGAGRLAYYTAIRIPQSIENPRLQRLVKQGAFRAEELTRLETEALRSLRDFAAGQADIEPTLQSVLEYNAVIATDRPWVDVQGSSTMTKLEQRYRKTLEDRPWTKCPCRICSDAGVEVVIFRASNRNKRRGIHNLGVFKGALDAATTPSDEAA